ncbi:MAG: type IV secretion system DNA-binding domain-containing protein [Pyrinomonadaceae bacterium]
MSWLKKLLNPNYQQKSQPEPTGSINQAEPEANPDYDLMASVREFEEMERLRQLDDLRAAYGETLIMLIDRHILQRIDRQKIFERLAPPPRNFTDDASSLNVIKVLPPPEATFADMGRFWNNLRVFRQPLSFTLISRPERMFFRLTVPQGCGEAVEEQLAIHFPAAVPLVPSEDERWMPESLYCVNFAPKFSTQFLDHSFVSRDPYAQLFSTLDSRAFNEAVAVQINSCPLPDDALDQLTQVMKWEDPGIPYEVFEPFADGMWSSIMQGGLDEHRRGTREFYEGLIKGIDRSHYEVAAPLRQALWQELARQKKLKEECAEMIKRIERKEPPWVACVNVYCEQIEVARMLQQSFLRQYETTEQRWEEITVTTEHYDPLDHPIFNWSLVSTEELTSLAHFPARGVTSPRLEGASMKSKLPPESFTTGEVQIGVSEARGQVMPVSIPDSVRARHLYIVGKSGSGKSTLITNIAVQDIERGEGVCVIDPHGDLVSDLLDHIPEYRIKDTIYFNVSDRAHPIGLDMMSAKNEAEIEILTDDLITTFRRLTETWGERMETILRYAFNTLLRTPGATFLDLQKLLTNEGWRSTVVRKINFAPLTDFWFNQFANMPKDATQPLLSRMTKIVLSPTLNAIFGQSQNTLNFNDVIRNRKILLINLGGDSRDRNNEQLSVSDEMKKLIGSVVVSQLQLAAMRQASIPEEKRVPCRFFVDEFQNFVSGAFPKILSEARKYKLSLTVAHQYISQLDEATRNAVFGNVGTMIVMPLGQKDASYLGAELGAYKPEDVANLSPERHEALCRPTTMAADTFLFRTLAPAPITQSFAQAVIEHTRAEYSTTDAGEDVLELPAPTLQESAIAKRPMRETEKVFASTVEKILHFISLAGYLTTAQIIELCYSHLAETSKRPAASRDLKKLTDAKKLKSINWGDGKVFYAGGQCNPTAHNVAIRDILIRILQSGYEAAEVNFSSSIGALSPDLLVTFLCEDGSLLPTYWEYDTGTEGITEIIKKIARYVPHSATSRVSFICTTKERVQSIMKATQADFIDYGVLVDFASLSTPAFISRTRTNKYSFF